MNGKYKNKYRTGSHRMPKWDYAGNGTYFITLVTKNRVCNLGEIVCPPDLKNLRLFMGDVGNGGGVGTGQGVGNRGSVEAHGRAPLRTPHIKLSEFGKIVDAEWQKSFEIRDELFLDEYIIMPNHLHAIVIINKMITQITSHGCATPQFIRKPRSLSSFIAGFKSAVNSKIDDFIDQHDLDIPKYNRQNHFFQSDYHDRIIRDNEEYLRIKKYIINNPRKWADDRLNSARGK